MALRWVGRGAACRVGAGRQPGARQPGRARRRWSAPPAGTGERSRPTHLRAGRLALGELTLGLRDTALLASRRGRASACGVRRRAPPAEVLLAWGRVERAAANADSAARRIRALSRRGRQPARGPAGARPHRPRRRRYRSGERAYYEGAELDDPAAVAGYRADLVRGAADPRAGRVRPARGSARAAFLRRFWTDRDRLEMRAPGERLREHYRRLLYARRHFALTVSRRFYGPADAYRSGGMEIDDRGVIYVRHGEPSDRLRPFVFGLMPNESWRFDRAEGDLLFHFSSGWDTNGGGDLYDYRLVESVLDLRGAGGGARGSAHALPAGGLPGVRPHAQLGSRSARPARARGSAASARRASPSARRRDSHELASPRRWARWRTWWPSARRDATTTRPPRLRHGGAGHPPDSADGGVRYAVRVRAVASDAKDRPFAEVDTTIVFRPRRRSARASISSAGWSCRCRPGCWNWRAAVQLGDSTRRRAAARHGACCRNGQRGFCRSAISRSACARPAPRWEPTPGDTVLLTPFDLFREGSEVELYYEAAGATAGADYRHEIAVYRLKGEPAHRRAAAGRGPRASTSGCRARWLRSHRVLQLARLKPGRYLVEVQIRPPDGGTVAGAGNSASCDERLDKIRPASHRVAVRERTITR